MADRDLTQNELYINRELSWLEFNDRVLREALNGDVPALERLKFLAIVSSNLDEFFMIRVAGLKQAANAGSKSRDVSGLTARQQLQAIAQRVHRMVADQSKGIAEVGKLLDAEGLHLVAGAAFSAEQEHFLAEAFTQEILPVLTPLAAEELDPFPLLPGLRLNVAVVLQDAASAGRRTLIVPVPATLPRFVTIPAEKGLWLTRLEDVIARNIASLFPGQRVLSTAVFRLTRDGDVAVNDDEVEDLLKAVEEAVRDRRRRAVVRLEISDGTEETLRKWLIERFEVQPADVYDIPGMLDAAALMEVTNRPGFESLRDKDWPAQRPQDLPEEVEVWQAVQEHDALLVHPYESFEPLLQLIARAAEDPAVLAIKQTLYRTSGTSPIIASLARAAEMGKQVTVLVELKARFDEAKNVSWARRLEDAGCHVIYGIAGYKTHAKVLLIVRRERHGIRRYVHLSTGNYNDRTARLYSDIGLLTADREIATDASAFFNLLTGSSIPVGWSRLAISPGGLRRRFEELIEREILASTAGEPGLIQCKLNSLQDEGMIQLLYRASMAGVKIKLNVRGICCLRPGVPGVSENIQVTSIVDRYLEHARIFYFGNGGHEEVYLSSADWMTRNLDKRLEVLFPVMDEPLLRRVKEMLKVYLSDNVKAWTLQSDGSYKRVPRKGKPMRAQEWLYQQAVSAAKLREGPPVEFRPLTRPEQ